MASCGSVRYVPPEGADPKATWATPKSFDDTWQAVVQTFAEANTPIKILEKASGIICAERQLAQGALSALYVDLGTLNNTPLVGGVPPPEWQNLWATFVYNVFVKRDADSNVVSVGTAWRGEVTHRFDNAWSGQRVLTPITLRGISTGLFERELLTSIAAKLGDASPKIEMTGGPKPRPPTPPPRRDEH
jgi:hypothetical protein